MTQRSRKQSGSYGQVLRNAGLPSFLTMQFLNAFNENMYKLVVSLLAVLFTPRGTSSGTYLALAGFIFVLPYLLFSGYAGQLADRFEKRTVVIGTKALEIVAMLLALFALMYGSLAWMLVVLFMTATQAALFSPAKYGIVPELVPDRHLARANGLLEMSTFVAVILGAVGGTLLVAGWKGHPGYIGAVLVAIAVMGTAVSIFIPRTAAPGEQRAFSANPFADVLTGVSRLKEDLVLKQSVLGTTYFWFLGALLQMDLLLFGKEALHCSESQIGILLASLAVGIGVGSMLAGRLSGERIEAGLVPVGGLGMSIALSLIAASCRWAGTTAAALAVLGWMGGLFIVPLNAFLQHLPAPGEKGRVIATANFVNTVGIMAASGLMYGLHDLLHVAARSIMGISAVLTFGAALYALRLVSPQKAARLVLATLTKTFYRVQLRGIEHIPATGPALIVANHVSYMDGFLIGSFIQPVLRFLVDEVWFDRFAPILKMFNAIRVPGGNRRSVLKAIEIAREQLQAGEVVCIFAEGSLTLTGNIGEFRRGVERIVAGLEAPIVPVHIGGMWGSVLSHHPRASWLGSLRAFFKPVTLSFGAPMFDVTAADVRSAVLELAADAANEAYSGHETLAARFVRCAKRNWRRRALTESSGRTLTYGEALVAARLVARRLDRNCGTESAIGVMLPASAAAAVANLGVVTSGRVVVNLNFTSGVSGLDSAIEQSEIRTIVTSRQFLSKANLQERPGMVFVEDWLRFGKTEKAFEFVAARLFPVAWLCKKAGAADVAAILFSSGSTGQPKGVMLSHGNLLANTDSVNALFAVGTGDTIAGVLPLFHAFGFTYTLWFPLLTGASVAYHPQPLDGKGVGELIAKTQATFLPAPPTFCQAYVRACTREQLQSLRYVLVGAERLSPGLASAFEDKFGIPLLEGYGATEMAPVISVKIPNRERSGVKQQGFKAGTVGQTIPGVAAKVVNAESGAPLRTGEEGLLLVKGANRMIGYLNRADETAAVLRDGWYVTGDIVVMDSAGFIRIVDRQSRFSKIGGEMVPHGSVEDAIQRLFPEARCAVTAIADERRGERLVVFVSGVDQTPGDVWSALLQTGLPRLWLPKREDLRVVNELPLLGTGKVDLSALKRIALAEADSGRPVVETA